MDKRKSGDQNEGEGNKTADASYRKHVREFTEQHDVDALARAAEREVDKDPKVYRDAEEAGKKRMAEEDPEVSGKK